MSKQIELIEAVNNAATEREHDRAEAFLRGWRQGVEDSGRRWDPFEGDLHYFDQGIERPMCCGVFIDWKPKVQP